MNREALHQWRGHGPAWAPYALLAVMLCLSALSAWIALKLQVANDGAFFMANVERVRRISQRRLDECVVSLDGLSSLQASGVNLGRPQFRAYVDSLHLSERQPGVRNLGLGHSIPASEKEAELQRLREHGETSIRFWPDSDQTILCPITHFAPADGGPPTEMGYDLYTNPAVAAALNQARENGETVCSAVFTAAHPAGAEQRGFVIVSPIFPGPKKPASLEERARRLYGYYFCTVSAGDFFTALAEVSGGAGITWTVYDGAADPNHLVFGAAETAGASRAPFLNASAKLTVANRDFTVILSKSPPERGGALAILLFGGAVSFLCFGVARMRIKSRREREMHSQALRSTGAKFQRLVEQSIVGIYAVQDGRFSYVNPKMAEIFGYTEEELTSRPLSEFIAPESRAAVKSQIERRMKGAVESIRYGLRAVRKDGQVLDLESHGGRIEEDGCTAILGCLIDVTEIKATERRLSAFATLGQKLGAARNAVEAAGIVSEIADQLLGWDACTLDLHSVEENRVHRVLHLDRTDRGTRIAERSADAPARADVHEPAASAERPAFAAPARPPAYLAATPQSILSAPVRDGSNVIGLLTIEKAGAGAYDQRDLDTLQALADHCGGALNRLRSEEAHARLSKEMHSLLESTREGIYGMDAEGRCTFINDAAAAMLGFARAELLHKDIHELTHRHGPDGQIFLPAECPVCGPLKTGQPREMDDDQFWRRDGRAFPVRYASDPIVEEGAVRGAVVTFSDISERKRIEREILELNATLERRVEERTLALEVSNKELESFSFSVSHDLRAPLRGIAGFGLALSQGWGDKLDGKGKEYLKRVLAAADRMGELIDDLLNLSRVSRSEMQRRTVDLSIVAKTVLEDLRRSSPERGLEMVIAEKACVEGDERLLRIVLENLLGNAWKFTAQKEAARIEFGAFLDSGGQRICFVRDNGAGFDMAYADKLFGVFQRLHGAHEFPGTGVGLATVQRIIHRHGGRIWAEAAVNEGATFYFTV